MTKAQQCLVIALDLGTSATTGQWALAADSYNRRGELDRNAIPIKNPVDMRAWQGANGDPLGNICLPTDLVYERATKKLLHWGFWAKEYLDEPSPDIPREDVFVVQHI